MLDSCLSLATVNYAYFDFKHSYTDNIIIIGEVNLLIQILAKNMWLGSHEQDNSLSVEMFSSRLC